MNSRSITINSGGLSNPKVVALLQQHLEEMASHTPAESVHALDLKSLQLPEISFWTAWIGNDLAGCAALKKLNPLTTDLQSAELKSMRTSDKYRRCGVASCVLAHLIELARQENYTTLYLETGSQPAFTAAKQLYQKFGFTLCDPFADYIEDPNSIFMQLQL